MALGDIVPWRKRTPASRSSWPFEEGEESPFFALQRRMNRLFEDFFSDAEGTLSPASELRTAGFSPRINLNESEKEIVITAELPGMEEKDFEVSLDRDSLVISGEKHTEHRKSEKGRSYYERSAGSFRRTIPLSCRIDEDGVKATYKNGILTLTLPKTAEAQKETRKISVKAG